MFVSKVLSRCDSIREADMCVSKVLSRCDSIREADMCVSKRYMRIDHLYARFGFKTIFNEVAYLTNMTLFDKSSIHINSILKSRSNRFLEPTST